MADSAKHDWPIDGGHVYGQWMAMSRSEEYRQCVHPDCKHFELRKAAKA